MGCTYLECFTTGTAGSMCSWCLHANYVWQFKYLTTPLSPLTFYVILSKGAGEWRANCSRMETDSTSLERFLTRTQCSGSLKTMWCFVISDSLQLLFTFITGMAHSQQYASISRQWTWIPGSALGFSTNTHNPIVSRSTASSFAASCTPHTKWPLI